MELRILCKRLIADDLDGKFTVGENAANTVGITLPRYYEKYDLSLFSFRITAAGESKNSATQVLETDNFDEKSVHLLWTVTSDFTAVCGETVLILTGVNSDNNVTVKFLSCPITINPDKSWEFLPSAELSEQLLNQVQVEVRKAIDAADRAEIASKTPAPAQIYPATTETLGGVKADGKTITVSYDGTISAKETQNLAVQIAHPNNYLIYDDIGKPSVMVAIPKFYLDEVIDGASHTVHPAFIINGVEQEVIYISKYQNIVEDGRAYSLPMKDSAVNVNFDQAWNYCKNKGTGWHLMTNAEWAAIALWCRKNSTLPRGNNNYGKDISETNLPPITTAAKRQSVGRVAKILTGSGREGWYHNGTFSGIADLNGNVWEWNSGLRIVDGEIQILANNDAADWNNLVSNDSPLWKAVKPDGSLVSTGTDESLKWDYTVHPTGPTDKFQLSTTIKNVQTTASICGIKTFKSLIAENGLNVPEILKSLAVFPDGTNTYDEDRAYLKNKGEQFLTRGGAFATNSGAGIFALDLRYSRNLVTDSVGFRCAYYGNI